MNSDAPLHEGSLAILASGGLDSAVLLGEAVRKRRPVHPLYIRSGLYWEGAELTHLKGILDALRCRWLAPLTILECPVTDLYGEHWSLTGIGVPNADSPDEAVFLPGRNVLLLSKALLWCHLHEVRELALATLAANPFPDATPAFFAAFCAAVNQAMAGQVAVSFPYAGLDKTAVIRRSQGLPLERTLSCMRPTAGRHCGTCNKCAERRRAFAQAGLADPTDYAEVPCIA